MGSGVVLSNASLKEERIEYRFVQNLSFLITSSGEVFVGDSFKRNSSAHLNKRQALLDGLVASDGPTPIKLVPLLSRRKAICGSSFFGFSGRTNSQSRQERSQPRGGEGGEGGQ